MLLYNSMRCGGTIITRQHILTAAHCFFNEYICLYTNITNYKFLIQLNLISIDSTYATFNTFCYFSLCRVGQPLSVNLFSIRAGSTYLNSGKRIYISVILKTYFKYKNFGFAQTIGCFLMII